MVFMLCARSRLYGILLFFYVVLCGAPSVLAHEVPPWRTLEPGVEICAIPGITSFQAAAAATGQVLCEAGENLLLVSGLDEQATAAKILAEPDNIVILKVYKNFQKLRELLQAQGLNEKCTFVSRLGLPGETVCRELAAAPEQPPYLSMLLVNKRGQNNGRAGE